MWGHVQASFLAAVMETMKKRFTTNFLPWLTNGSSCLAKTERSSPLRQQDSRAGKPSFLAYLAGEDRPFPKAMHFAS